MDWLQGKPLLTFMEHTRSSDAQSSLACNMFRAWYVPFYGYGIIHGDPHLGNYTVRPTISTLNLLDFGCIRMFRADAS